MKTILCGLLWVALHVGANAQEPGFRHFQVWKDYSGGIWIVPSDIEQQLEAFRQEAEEKGLAVGAVSLKSVLANTPEKLRNDSLRRENLKKRGIAMACDTFRCHPLVRWLRADCLEPKSAEPCPPEWSQAIASVLAGCADGTLASRLAVYALVNDKGEALSVYFSADSAIARSVREEDLQGICDAITGTPFDPCYFDFHRWDANLVNEFVAKASIAGGEELSGEERLAWMRRIWEETIPCVYGIVECFKPQRLMPGKEHVIDYQKGCLPSNYCPRPKGD